MSDNDALLAAVALEAGIDRTARNILPGDPCQLFLTTSLAIP